VNSPLDVRLSNKFICPIIDLFIGLEFKNKIQQNKEYFEHEFRKTSLDASELESALNSSNSITNLDKTILRVVLEDKELNIET